VTEVGFSGDQTGLVMHIFFVCVANGSEGEKAW